MQMGDFERDFFLGLEGRNAVQFRLQRLQTSRFDPAFVHTSRPIVADLLLHGAAIRIVLATRFQSLAQYVLIPQFQAASGAPVNLVGRNRIGGDPFVAGVLVEVVTGIQALVDQIGSKCSSLGAAVSAAAPAVAPEVEFSIAFCPNTATGKLRSREHRMTLELNIEPLFGTRQDWSNDQWLLEIYTYRKMKVPSCREETIHSSHASATYSFQQHTTDAPTAVQLAQRSDKLARVMQSGSDAVDGRTQRILKLPPDLGPVACVARARPGSGSSDPRRDCADESSAPAPGCAPATRVDRRCAESIAATAGILLPACAKTRVAQCRVLYQSGINAGNVEIGFGHAQFDVAHQVRKEREVFRHLAQQPLVTSSLRGESSASRARLHTTPAQHDGSASIQRPTEWRAGPPGGGPWCGAMAGSRCGPHPVPGPAWPARNIPARRHSRRCRGDRRDRLPATFPPWPLPSAPDPLAELLERVSASRLAAIISSKFHSASTASAYFQLRTSPCSVMRMRPEKQPSGCARIAECVGPPPRPTVPPRPWKSRSFTPHSCATLCRSRCALYNSQVLVSIPPSLLESE